ncbi:adenine deaminase [Caldibacillus lycopersici]|uniref:Adenine deaminase n=1 Tax=Perspicuibacillus lycopersici TaxID=1325689 RepID=A0AAE3LU34_9BACI|nr:adenine deaminase [Perspicuibacillus lycopersici]MCU9615133.1 adenine deaminase [Perspicuibacillus lycopersici]
MEKEKELLRRKLDVASKRVPADVVIKGGKIVDVFNLQIKEADIAIVDGMIVGIGTFEGEKMIDATGKYIAPSFIDGHVHIESSMVTPKEFAKVLLPHGVTTVITDPHEIANVSGTEGISFMLQDSEGLDLDVFVMLPSCVPATSFENSGAVLNNEHLESFYSHPRVLGLAEVMDLPSVENNEEQMLNKLVSASIHRNHIDGHCAGFDENDINIYRTAGIQTDHESVQKAEVEMRISRGMHVLIREGTSTRNLAELIQMVTPYNARRFLFCTDDKHIDDLVMEGSIDFNIRKAIQLGMDPLQAIQLGTLNAAECYSLSTKGAVAPGYQADLVFLSDLETVQIWKVMKAGQIIVENGSYLGQINAPGKTETNPSLENLLDTVSVGTINKEDLKIYIGDNNRANIIGIIPNQIVTKKLVEEVTTEDGYFIPDSGRDLVKLAVIERHRQTGNIGLGIVKGFGLETGAIASTVAHDSHNIVVAGTNDQDMLKAIEAIKEMKGGLVVIKNEEVIGKIGLEICGLMSSKGHEVVLEEVKNIYQALYQISNDPNIGHFFITLSFLSLPVIPQLKLTDKGLFDVTQFKHIPIQI